MELGGREDMYCNDQRPEFVVNLITNGVGMILTGIAILCIATNGTVEPSIGRILLSFSIANIIGASMLTYDAIQMICLQGAHTVGFLVTITLLLSISHVMLLTLAEYIILTSRTENNAGNYIGLITLSWIISISAGSLDVTTNHLGKVVFAVIFSLIISYILTKYYVIMKLHMKKERLRESYKLTYLRGDSRRHNNKKKYWRPKLFSIIIFSYIGCSIPWLVNELQEGLQREPDDAFIHSLTLIVYSLNFYFPSAVCVYLRYQEWKSQRKECQWHPQISAECRETLL